MNYNIAVVKGDGIGPEIVSEAMLVLDKVGEKFGHSFTYEEVLLGGCATDAVGKSYPDGTAEKCRACDAVLLGCGLGRGRQTDALVRRLMDLPQPLVLDADGINALAGHMDEWERRRGRVTVLTPHEGEFLRVGGNLSQGRTAAATEFAHQSGAVVVLKGPGTVVAGPDGRCRVNTTGNCGMAKGGSGDVLSGVVLALLGLGMDAFDACCCAVWLHGRAGDLAAQEKGQWGMTPTDLLERLPQALREVTE